MGENHTFSRMYSDSGFGCKINLIYEKIRKAMFSDEILQRKSFASHLEKSRPRGVVKLPGKLLKLREASI